VHIYFCRCSPSRDCPCHLADVRYQVRPGVCRADNHATPVCNEWVAGWHEGDVVAASSASRPATSPISPVCWSAGALLARPLARSLTHLCNNRCASAEGCTSDVDIVRWHDIDNAGGRRLQRIMIVTPFIPQRERRRHGLIRYSCTAVGRRYTINLRYTFSLY